MIEEYNRYEGLTLCTTDRFKGYNPLKIERQLCFEHLKRDLDNLLDKSDDCGIQNYQNIWRNEWQSLFHWTQNRNIRCENNTAERAVRPLVIVRKISFGSQGDQGVRNREIITTVLNTVRLRGVSPQLWLMDSLNKLAQDTRYDIAENLPPANPVYERKLKAISSG